MTKYNWQLPDWPNFKYDLADIHETLLLISEKVGLISGKLTHLAKDLQMEALINTMVEEAIKTSKIEGESINPDNVRSSIINKLGLANNTTLHDKRADALAELMIDVRNTYLESLTDHQLFNWHLMLLSSSSNSHLKVGCWRIDAEPMQIVSGHHGNWKIHYEAPPADKVPEEMERFISWFNQTAPMQKDSIKFAPVRAAIAHLYFESIHPFNDGNGRIGRAIAEKALSQGFAHPIMLSLSNAIEADRKSYYAHLNKASLSNEITTWIAYFVNIILRAQLEVEHQIDFILKKSLFFKKFEKKLNERQIKVIHRMLKAGIKGFEGGMSAKKYMIIADTSKATATRDLQDLLEMEAFIQMGKGRSVRYELNL